MADRAVAVAVPFPPAAGPGVQYSADVTPAATAFTPKKSGKEAVVTVPVPGVVQRDKEHVGRFEEP